MLPSREKTADWLWTAVFTAMWALLLWSLGTVVLGPFILFNRADEIFRLEYQPLSLQAEASATIRARRDSVVANASMRTKKARGLLPDTVTRRTRTTDATDDSMARVSYDQARATARDSASIAALRGLDLDQIDSWYLMKLEEYLSRERRFWDASSALNWAKVEGTPTAEQWEAFFDAGADFQLSLEGSASVERVAIEAFAARVQRLDEIGSRFRREVRAARLRWWGGLVGLTVSVLVLQRVWTYVRTGRTAPQARPKAPPDGESPVA